MSVNRKNGRSSCNSSCINLASISVPNNKFKLTPEGIKKLANYTLCYRFNFMVPLVSSIIHGKRKKPITPLSPSQIVVLENNIEVGDIVEILLEGEIRRTLDKNEKLKGLTFMPEMKKYCGEQFRVLKKVTRIKMESTGEMRTLKHPSYILEGVYCDGEFHDKCERFCFLFWRKEWLKKA